MADLIVVGGGIVGSAAAYWAARQGAQVTLVDRSDQGQATAAGAGILAPGTSHNAPPAFYPLSARSMAFYPELIAALAEDGERNTGYDVAGELFVATTEDEAAQLPAIRRLAEERRAAGVQGIGEVRAVTASEAQALFPALGPIVSALFLSGAARVNGRLLRDSLQGAAVRHGAVILQGSAGLERRGSQIVVQVSGEWLPEAPVIIVGGTWSAELGKALGVPIPVQPQRGQILHLDLPESETGGWPIITGFHSHYILTFPPHRVVAGATRETGSGFDYRVTVGGVNEVTGEALRIAPGLSPGTVVEFRVGMRPASPDGLPILGAVPGSDNAFLATGHGPSGLQLGPYSGAAVASLALGTAPDLDLSPYSPQRFFANAH